ncbi:proliferating cell nuclear antigen (pcna) [Candidatus Woesearchaeota archaeon]|nr:proliferating cell nuclear antigen (pcna) [Candidatus Woesearchaeota archaeon]|tara:strand:- start:1356 stop:2093 length:738 start_codon:yes stop_codon:yes gene_type:complete
MKLTLAETRLFKDSIGIISDLVNEAKFNITKEAIEMIAMDPANVAMVMFKLLSSSFVEYDVKETTTIALNLNDLKQVLRRVKPNDTLTLELEEGKLVITLKSTTKRTFAMPLIDYEEKEQKVPELVFDVQVQMLSKVFSEAVEDVDIVGESVKLIVDPETFVISSSGDMTNASVEIKKTEETDIKTADKVNAKYSVEYLKKIIQGSKLADTITIRFSKDYPLKLEYTSLNQLQLSFILAPRVDND